VSTKHRKLEERSDSLVVDLSASSKVNRFNAALQRE
jgi:hypothetical protein